MYNEKVKSALEEVSTPVSTREIPKQLEILSVAINELQDKLNNLNVVLAPFCLAESPMNEVADTPEVSTDAGREIKRLRQKIEDATRFINELLKRLQV